MPVTLVARSRALEVIARDGLRIRRPHGDDVVRVDVVASIAQARPTAADTIVLAVKAQDAEATVAQIAWTPLVDGRGVVADLPILTLQNGLAAEDIALRRFHTVIGVSIGIPASHLEPGVIVSPAYPIVGAAWLGGFPASLPGEEERHRVALAKAGFATAVELGYSMARNRLLETINQDVTEYYRAHPVRPVRQAAAAEAL